MSFHAFSPFRSKQATPRAALDGRRLLIEPIAVEQACEGVHKTHALQGGLQLHPGGDVIDHALNDLSLLIPADQLIAAAEVEGPPLPAAQAAVEGGVIPRLLQAVQVLPGQGRILRHQLRGHALGPVHLTDLLIRAPHHIRQGAVENEQLVFSLLPPQAEDSAGDRVIDAGQLGAGGGNLLLLLQLLLHILPGLLGHLGGKPNIPAEHLRIRIGDVEQAAPGPPLRPSDTGGDALVHLQINMGGWIGGDPHTAGHQAHIGGNYFVLVLLIRHIALGHLPLELMKGV